MYLLKNLIILFIVDMYHKKTICYVLVPFLQFCSFIGIFVYYLIINL